MDFTSELERRASAILQRMLDRDRGDVVRSGFRDSANDATIGIAETATGDDLISGLAGLEFSPLVELTSKCLIRLDRYREDCPTDSARNQMLEVIEGVEEYLFFMLAARCQSFFDCDLGVIGDKANTGEPVVLAEASRPYRVEIVQAFLEGRRVYLMVQGLNLAGPDAAVIPPESGDELINQAAQVDALDALNGRYTPRRDGVASLKAPWTREAIAKCLQDPEQMKRFLNELALSIEIRREGSPRPAPSLMFS